MDSGPAAKSRERNQISRENRAATANRVTRPVLSAGSALRRARAAGRRRHRFFTCRPIDGAAHRPATRPPQQPRKVGRFAIRLECVCDKRKSKQLYRTQYEKHPPVRRQVLPHSELLDKFYRRQTNEQTNRQTNKQTEKRRHLVMPSICKRGHNNSKNCRNYIFFETVHTTKGDTPKGHFYRAMLCIARTIPSKEVCLCLSVRPSVRHTPVFCRNG